MRKRKVARAGVSGPFFLLSGQRTLRFMPNISVLAVATVRVVLSQSTYVVSAGLRQALRILNLVKLILTESGHNNIEIGLLAARSLVIFANSVSNCPISVANRPIS